MEVNNVNLSKWDCTCSTCLNWSCIGGSDLYL